MPGCRRPNKMYMSRKDKIMALLPPPTSSDEDLSSEDDLEQGLKNIPQEDTYYSDTSSEAASIPESANEILKCITDNLSGTDTAESGDEITFAPLKSTDQNLLKHKSIFTPIKTRSMVTKNDENCIEEKECEKENEVPTDTAAHPAVKKRHKGKKLEIGYSWQSEEFEFPVDIPPDHFTTPHNYMIKSPLDYFKMFFSEDLIELIVENTNLYSTQRTGKSINVTKNDICDFVAIHIFMGIVDMPSYLDYWSQTLRYDEVADTMPLKKYQQIRRHIHFVNNNNQDNDQYFKIRPVMDIIRRNCLEIENERRQSIDEMMVPYKGKKAGSRRQYIKSKPRKWGIKIFARAGISGFVYDFIVYGGDDTFRQHQFDNEEISLGLGAKVIIALSQSLRNPACTALYFDNFFSSFDLFYILRQKYGILALGTIRTNRLRNCKIIDDKTLAKKGRGSFAQMADNDNKLTCVKWYDNKAVTLVSTYVSAYPVGTIKRFVKGEKKKIEIPCPNIIKHYNSHMGGVDLMDMLVSLYRITMKGRRWYLSIFAQMLDICINNSWILYRRERQILKSEGDEMSLKEFRYTIAKSLKMTNRAKKKRASSANPDFKEKKIYKPVVPRPPADVRHDNVDHFPLYTTKGRCRHCRTGETHWICTKCNCRLCLVKDRNCFHNFHALK